jgi:GxxExxY protein
MESTRWRPAGLNRYCRLGGWGGFWRRNTTAREPLIERERTESIIGAFYTVYNTLGFGYVERVYTAAFVKELMKRRHSVKREHLVGVLYDDEIIAFQKMDLIVDDLIVVENKVTDGMLERDERQVQSYLKCTNLEVGLLFYFTYKPRFRRLVHTRG